MYKLTSDEIEFPVMIKGLKVWSDEARAAALAARSRGQRPSGNYDKLKLRAALATGKARTAEETHGKHSSQARAAHLIAMNAHVDAGHAADAEGRDSRQHFDRAGKHSASLNKIKK